MSPRRLLPPPQFHSPFKGVTRAGSNRPRPARGTPLLKIYEEPRLAPLRWFFTAAMAYAAMSPLQAAPVPIRIHVHADDDRRPPQKHIGLDPAKLPWNHYGLGHVTDAARTNQGGSHAGAARQIRRTQRRCRASRQWPAARPYDRQPHHAARRLARAPRADRHQEGLRPRPVRRLHRACRRPARAVLPDARGHASRARTSPRSKASPAPTARCIRCSRPSSITTPSSAATARRARSCRRSPASRKATPAATTQIREYMSGNLCRCAAYPNIVAAVNQAKAADEGGLSMRPFAFDARRRRRGRHPAPAHAASQRSASRRASCSISPAAPR